MYRFEIKLRLFCALLHIDIEAGFERWNVIFFFFFQKNA